MMSHMRASTFFIILVWFKKIKSNLPTKRILNVSCGAFHIRQRTRGEQEWVSFSFELHNSIIPASVKWSRVGSFGQIFARLNQSKRILILLLNEIRIWSWISDFSTSSLTVRMCFRNSNISMRTHIPVHILRIRFKSGSTRIESNLMEDN